jgi:hypothetical protein
MANSQTSPRARARGRAMAIHENRPAGPDRNLVTPTATLFLFDVVVVEIDD